MNNSKFKLGQEVYAMELNEPARFYIGAILECDDNMFLYKLTRNEKPLSYIDARVTINQKSWTFESKIFATPSELKDSLFNKALA